MGIERLRLVNGEVESSFATENGAHSWTSFRAIDPQVTPGQLMHDELENKARITQGIEQVLGRKSEGSRLSFGLYLRGDGDALTSGASPSDDALQSLLGDCMGGSRSGDGTTIASTSTTTVLECTHTSGLAAGGACLVEDAGGSGINQIGLIESISGTSVTLKNALSNAPSTGKVVWGAYTSYVDPSATDTWQFRALGDAAADIWLLLGVIGGFGLANLLQINELARINFDLFCTSWEKDVATLDSGTFDGGDMLETSEAMEIHYQNHGTTTRNLISVSALEVNPGIVWTPLNARGNADVQHVDRIRMTQCTPTVNFTADPSSAFWTIHSARTAKYLAIMFGRTAGQSWCLELPNIKTMQAPARGSHAEQIATQCGFRCFEDDAGDADSALTRSPLRLHRL